MASTPSKFDSNELGVRPLSPVFGAEISGVDLISDFTADVALKILPLIYQYKVLVFRDQHALGPEGLARFAELFGVPETEAHPELPNFPGVPAVKVITKDGSYGQDTWHTDGATRGSTRWFSFLQAIDIPPYGRDTLFADMEAVFDGLSEPLKAFLSPMKAEHSWGVQRPEAPPIEHPVIKTCPTTGRKTLYVNRGYTRRLLGLHPQESDMLLEFLFRRAYIPEHQLRVVWRPGTVTVWDNERTQHYIVQDSHYRRTMHRVMVQAPEFVPEHA